MSAVFSASETSLTSLSKIRLRNMVEEKVKGADILDRVTKSPKNLITTILIGNNLVNIAASSITTKLSIDLSGGGSYALALSTAVTTLMILIFGEIMPKTLASQNTEKIALALVKFVNLCMVIFKPIVYTLNIITSSLVKVFGGDPEKAAPLITQSEFKTLVKVGEEEGVIEVEEKEMIDNVFGLGDTKASDVMTPRTDMVAVPIDASYEEVKGIFLSTNFTRIPVYKDSTDNIEGIIHLKDLAFKDINDFDISKYLREVYFTYETKPTSELFKEMRSKSIPIAIVIDEYGGTSGIVSLEDLIEEIVGDITDEYDEDNREIEVVKEDEYIVLGSTRIDYLNDMIGVNIESEDSDTIGGYIMELTGRIPEQGEIVQDDGVKFIIETIDKNRIERVKVFT
jgi:putative hemolysin